MISGTAKSSIVIFCLELFAGFAMASDGGAVFYSTRLSATDIAFDGRSLTARIAVEGIRDAYLDTRFAEARSVRVRNMFDCSGKYIPVIIGFLDHLDERGPGELLLLRAGDRFERDVSLELLRKPLAAGTCVEMEFQLLAAADANGNAPVIGTFKARTVVGVSIDGGVLNRQ